MSGGGQLTLETNNCSLDIIYCAQNPGAIPGKYVQLVISDNGTGILPEDQERIFDPFFTTKPQGKGTGLGLSMVFGFVKRSKGHIKVYSEQGIGTTLRLYFPQTENQEAPNEVAVPAEEPLPRGQETILVVDDEKDLLELACSFLQTLGYHVLKASNGQQALKYLAKERNIALLFSDLVMPGGINGYELAEQATEMHPNIQVLLTSGYTEKAIASNGQGRFASNLLSKPYQQTELAQRIRLLLEKFTMTSSNNPDGLKKISSQTAPSSVELENNLNTGIKAIDEDHRVLLSLLNQPVGEKLDQFTCIQQPQIHLSTHFFYLPG